MRKTRVKQLRKSLKSILGEEEIPPRVWRHYKRSYLRS